MHNFVLACPTCNRSKSDTLAAKVHLDKWIELTKKNAKAIAKIGEQIGVSSSLETSIAIAKWGYVTATHASVNFWVRSRHYERLIEPNPANIKKPYPLNWL
jgi:hypothetical protein